MEASAFYPGSSGEIIQGRINGMDMLLSVPINLFTHVRVFESKSPVNRFKYQKASTFLKNILTIWGFPELDLNMDIEIKSNIPMGKGFASSTADLKGVYISLLKLFNRDYDIHNIKDEFIKIEPTDSIIFPKASLFEYKKGSSVIEIGDYFKFNILVFEGKRIIDTVAFNSSNIPPLKDLSHLIKGLYKGFKNSDAAMIAEISEESIIKNNGRLEYEALPLILDIKKKTGGLGILGSHSGDMLGIIFNDSEKAKYALKYKDFVPGYKGYIIETLRREEYENSYDNCTIKRQWEDIMCNFNNKGN